MFPIIGENDIYFELYILEDGRHVYALCYDGKPLIGFDYYGADELVDAIRECQDELSGINDLNV